MRLRPSKGKSNVTHPGGGAKEEASRRASESLKDKLVDVHLKGLKVEKFKVDVVPEQVAKICFGLQA